MPTRINIYTDRKGSNPGGKCLVTTPHSEFDAYIKYCPGTGHSRTNARLPTHFRPTHQPFYEAITLELARIVGLEVPDFYVLMRGSDLTFSFENHALQRGINQGMPVYFVSKLMEIPLPGHEEKGAKEALAREKIYRDLLMVSDISNKAQNFRYDPNEDGMLYLDLGCSFVNAIEGRLEPHRGKLPIADKRNRKEAEKKAKEYALITADGESIHTLEELIDITPSFQVPILNPRGRIPIGRHLTEGEIEDIRELLTMNVLSFVRKYKDHERIVRV